MTDPTKALLALTEAQASILLAQRLLLTPSGGGPSAGGAQIFEGTAGIHGGSSFGTQYGELRARWNAGHIAHELITLTAPSSYSGVAVGDWLKIAYASTTTPDTSNNLRDVHLATGSGSGQWAEWTTDDQTILVTNSSSSSALDALRESFSLSPQSDQTWELYLGTDDNAPDSGGVRGRLYRMYAGSTSYFDAWFHDQYFLEPSWTSTLSGKNLYLKRVSTNAWGSLGDFMKNKTGTWNRHAFSYRWRSYAPS